MGWYALQALGGNLAHLPSSSPAWQVAASIEPMNLIDFHADSMLVIDVCPSPDASSVCGRTLCREYKPSQCVKGILSRRPGVERSFEP